MNRHDLYECCVQDPPGLVAMLRAIHGGDPAILGEDFCGTAAASRVWVAATGGSAIAIDHDRAVIDAAPPVEGVELICADVRTADAPVDILHVGNFSVGEFHERADLVDYLRHARSRLRPGGVFVCDIYGGESAFLTGEVDRDYPLPDGRIVRYTWEQRGADAFTGRVINAIHFELDGAVTRDAFVYDWRLWSVPELRDALVEAGFASTAIYARTPDAVDDTGRAHVVPLRDSDDVEESFDVLVAARV